MRPALDVADIFRRHGDAYRAAHGARMGRVERRLMVAIEACRTAALAGHVEACEDCPHSRIAYNSCGNRHCPKCQGLARADWLAKRQADLLPVPYFHVVFAVPAKVAAMAFQNKAVVYAILFQAAAETLRRIAVAPLIEDIEFAGLIADKAFDSDNIIEDMNERGTQIVISQHPRRTKPLNIDAEIYRWRHLVENFFCKLKEFKPIAMRSDKTDTSFQAMIYASAAIINSR